MHIDTLLTDCAVVTPIEVPAKEIESDEEDDEFRPMRVSSKDHATTETKGEWTQERPGKPLRSKADSFRRRPPPVLTSSSRHSITHDDLHPSMVMENTPDELILPFKHGWIREIVIRNVRNEGLRDLDRKHTAADTYYYAPEKYGSVKLRSLVRVADFLMDKDISNLTSNNFSFAKRSIYKHPEEFIKLAGKFTSRKLAAVKQKAEASTISSKTTPTIASSSEVIASPAVLKDPTFLHKKSKNAMLTAILLERPGTDNMDRPILRKIMAYKGGVVRAKQFLMTHSQPSVSPMSSPKHTAQVVSSPRLIPAFIKKPQPCSQLCKGVVNTVPYAQCRACLSLFHPECIDWTTGGQCSGCIMNSRLGASRKEKNIMKFSLISKITAPLINQALSCNVASAAPKESKVRRVTICYDSLQKIDISAPFVLNLDNETFGVDPSHFIATKTGVEVFIKNGQLLHPSEVPVKHRTFAPSVQKKYSSTFDCYNRVSSPKPGGSIPESCSSDLDNSHLGESQAIKTKVIAPTSGDTGPYIISVQSLADLYAAKETSDTAGTKTIEITMDGPLTQLREMDANRVADEDIRQIIANLMDSMLEAITCYINDEQSKGLALKKEKSEKPQLVQVSTNQLHEESLPTNQLHEDSLTTNQLHEDFLTTNQLLDDSLTTNCNTINEQTDPRPTHARQVGSMSEEREARLRKDRERKAAARALENEEQRNKRLASNRERAARLRASWTDQQRQLRRAKDRVRITAKISLETDEQREQRLAHARERMAARRFLKTGEQHEQTLALERERVATKISLETGEQRKQRLAKDRQRHSAKRSLENYEQREQRLARERERIAAKRSRETNEQRKQRLTRERERIARKRSLQSDEQHKQRMGKNRERIIAKRSLETDEQREQRLALRIKPVRSLQDTHRNKQKSSFKI
ncbi:uncharacterized protein [Watersipora subatra]|uniref:uncharacterized protein n=1 Tax=Watersipora subatra TaxID=2589382 RepID=UPI00355C8680